MGYSKLSVTVPDEIYHEMRSLASKKKMKLSHLVTEALAEKTRKMKEDALIQQINDAFSDEDLSDEHQRIAEAIAVNTDVKELPW